MPGDYLALKAELAKPDLAGLSDADAAAALAVAGPATPRPVPLLSLLQWTAGTGVRANIENFVDAQKAIAASAQSPAYALCLSMQDSFWGAFGAGHVFDVTDPAISGPGGMIDALVAAGVMTADQGDQLRVLAAAPGPTRAEAIPGWGLPATVADVAHARSL